MERFFTNLFNLILAALILLITGIGLKNYFQNLEKLIIADYIFIINSSSFIFFYVFLFLKSIKQPDYSFKIDHA